MKNYLDVPFSCGATKHENESSGKVYGNVTLDGNATAHLGDVHHHYLKDAAIIELLNGGQTGIVNTFKIAVQVASRLAFTDWHHSVQMLSMNVLYPSIDFESIPEGSQFEGLLAQAVAVCFDGIDSAILDKRLFVEDWIAFDLDGFIIARPAAWLTNITAIRGKLISFSNGKIMLDGSQYKKVRNDRANLRAGFKSPDNEHRMNAYLWTTNDDTCGFLRNKFPNVHLRPLLAPLGDTIFLRTEVYLDRGTPITIDSTKAASALIRLLVSDPCSHGYSDQYSVRELCESQTTFGAIFQGLHFVDSRGRGLVLNPKPNLSPVYIQQTKDNSSLQWLALQWSPDSEPDRCLLVLQKDCCVECLLERLGKIIGSIARSSATIPATGYPVCIIAGNSPKSLSTSRLPLHTRSAFSTNNRSPARSEEPLSHAGISTRRVVSETQAGQPQAAESLRAPYVPRPASRSPPTTQVKRKPLSTSINIQEQY